MDEQKPTVRRRVNVAHSVKGVATTDATFDAENLSEEDYSIQCLEFFAWVDANWPPPITLNG